MASSPTPAQLAKAGLAAVPNLPAQIAANGDHSRVWDATKETFDLATSATPYNAQLYAVPNSWLPSVESETSSLRSSFSASLTVTLVLPVKPPSPRPKFSSPPEWGTQWP